MRPHLINGYGKRRKRFFVAYKFSAFIEVFYCSKSFLIFDGHSSQGCDVSNFIASDQKVAPSEGVHEHRKFWKNFTVR